MLIALCSKLVYFNVLFTDGDGGSQNRKYTEILNLVIPIVKKNVNCHY